MRSTSEPPEQVEVNFKTGLRGGFPIKINGHALGSQDSLQEFGQEGDIFGPRIRSRQNSVTSQDGESENQFGRRRSLRGSTPVKIGGIEFTTNAAKEELLFSTPFGPTQASAGKIKKGGMAGKRSVPHNLNNNETNLGRMQNKSSSHSNISLSLSMMNQNVEMSNGFSYCKKAITRSAQCNGKKRRS